MAVNLTDIDKAAIKELYFKNWTTDAIGSRFGVTGMEIAFIIKKNGWRELRRSQRNAVKKETILAATNKEV